MTDAMTIRQLEHQLLDLFPESLAEDFDNVGLLFGDGDALVKRVAIALDPSIEAVQQAHGLGCNVLLTHHPVFLKPPRRFVESSEDWEPASAQRDEFGQKQAARVCLAAASAGVSLIALHTNLDFSPRSQRVIPELLGLEYKGAIQRMGDGLWGQLCTAEGYTLGELAAHCHDVLGAVPRVWGDLGCELKLIGIAPGSGGDLVQQALACGCDALITGEIRYHTATAALQGGLSVIDLGHDVSEQPFVAVLAKALVDLGYSQEQYVVLEEETCWQSVLLFEEAEEEIPDVAD